MEHGLIRQNLSSTAFLPISHDMYAGLKMAMEGLYRSLCIEESFDVVIENYVELETTLLKAALRHMVTGDNTALSFRTETNLFNRRLMNLLSACRSYNDHTQRHVQHLFGVDGKQSILIIDRNREVYDSSFVYRIFEKFRNHVQHKGSSIHSVTWDMRVPEKTGEHRLQYSVIPYILLKTLRADDKFNKKVLAEMEALGNKVDLRPIFRGYIAKLGEFHEAVRTTLKPSIEQWDMAVEKAFQDFLDKFSEEGSPLLLAAVRGMSKDTYAEKVSIFTDFIEFRRALVSKNTGLHRLPCRYVTSEAQEIQGAT